MKKKNGCKMCHCWRCASEMNQLRTIQLQIVGPYWYFHIASFSASAQKCGLDMIWMVWMDGWMDGIFHPWSRLIYLFDKSAMNARKVATLSSMIHRRKRRWCDVKSSKSGASRSVTLPMQDGSRRSQGRKVIAHVPLGAVREQSGPALGWVLPDPEMSRTI